MNYEESNSILEEIKKAEKILINCHRSPDEDSVGSALSLYLILKNLGKEVKIICPDDLPENLKFLPSSEKVERVNFEDFNFSEYNLFLSLDSSSLEMIIRNKKDFKINIPTINIDHHITNTKYGTINLVEKVSSCSEIMFLLYEDWGAALNKEIANCLLAGIIGDTGVFQYSGVTEKTFLVVNRLIGLGADKDDLILKIYKSMDFNKLKLWGKILEKIEIDKECRFIWAAVPFKTYKEYNEPKSVKETAASLFANSVKDTDFGFIMVEETEGSLSVSFRSRTNFDVSKLAEELGGGGHPSASGVRLYDISFEEATKKVLETARKYVKNYQR